MLNIKNNRLEEAKSKVPQDCEFKPAKHNLSAFPDATEYVIEGPHKLGGKINAFVERFDCERW